MREVGGGSDNLVQPKQPKRQLRKSSPDFDAEQPPHVHPPPLASVDAHPPLPRAQQEGRNSGHQELGQRGTATCHGAGRAPSTQGVRAFRPNKRRRTAKLGQRLKPRF